MSIKIGNIDVSYFKVGGADCSIYIGDVKMYPTTPPTPPAFEGKYKLTLSDSSTVSAECDATSAITQAEISAYTSTLVSAEIGGCVTSIGGAAFHSCSNLRSINIPSGVTSIGNQAFLNCYNISNGNNMIIPSGVTSIGSQAFKNCSNLTSMTILATTPPTLSNTNAFNGTTWPIYVPSGSVDTYKAADKWSSLSSRIQAIV